LKLAWDLLAGRGKEEWFLGGHTLISVYSIHRYRTRLFTLCSEFVVPYAPRRGVMRQGRASKTLAPRLFTVQIHEEY